MTHLERARALLNRSSPSGWQYLDETLAVHATSVKILAAEFAAVEAELLPQADAVGWALKEMNIALQRAQAAELRLAKLETP
jgi:hypothetical protein